MYKILIADDSHAERILIKEILLAHNIGTEIIEAVDGIEAVKQYSIHKPNLVLLDVEMPNMDGIEALYKIRQIDPEAKVIIISAVTDNETIKKAKQNGAQDYITKPFDEKMIITLKERL